MKDADIQKEEEEAKDAPLPLKVALFFSRKGYQLNKEYPYSLYTLDDIYHPE